ncbi:MAG TPA: 4-hydroxy-tetrahydrodipicolinate synthase [Actinomycetota bacterium]|nr:4-hydroxy-tetrahydrodipicolinate synthase [Actinomycetota bacterium]
MSRFGRVVTAMVTPFRDDLSLNVDEAQRLARHLVDSGSDGLVVAGSTGEGPTLTHEEKVTLFRAVADAVSGDAKVICGTGTYSTADTVELTVQAAKTGADGVLVVTPYYNKPPQHALLEHFRTVADASDLPVMLYDIPGRTALKIEVETLLKAAEHPRIQAVKQATDDLTSLARLMAAVPDGFELYSGQDDWTLALQAWGACGVVSVASHVVARKIGEQLDAFDRGDVESARRAQASYVPLVQALFCTTNPIPVKAAMNLLGFKAGPPRPPLGEARPEEVAQVRSALQAAGAL